MTRRLLSLTLLLTTSVVAGATESIQEASQRIDAAILADLKAANAKAVQYHDTVLALPPPVSDEVFLRRACIDLAGRLPRPDEVRAFGADSSADKRTTLVDHLVDEPCAAELRFRWLAEAFRVQDTVSGKDQSPFIQWLRTSTRVDMPYDQLVSAMITATGDVSIQPAAGFLQRDAGNPIRTAVEVARVFLGEDIHCAQCHDHPFNANTQHGLYAFASCFADLTLKSESSRQPRPLVPGAQRIGTGNQGDHSGQGLPLPIDYKYRDGKPGQQVQPLYLPIRSPTTFRLESSKGPSTFKLSELRADVAAWLTGKSNARFAEVAAVRVWESLFGAFFVDHNAYREGRAPEEAFHTTVIAFMGGTWGGCSSMNGLGLEGINYEETERGSATLRVLGMEFAKCGYRLREFQRVLARTQAYGRATLSRGAAGFATITPAPMQRRLAADVLWNAWAQLLQQTAAATKPSDALPQVPSGEHPLRLLGRATREWSDESEAPLTHELVRFMMNDPLIEAVAASPALCAPSLQDNDMIEHIFLATLGRLPQPQERIRASRHLGETPETGRTDIAWALLNTKEFLFHP